MYASVGAKRGQLLRLLLAAARGDEVAFDTLLDTLDRPWPADHTLQRVDAWLARFAGRLALETLDPDRSARAVALGDSWHDQLDAWTGGGLS